jgi:DNA-binding beta-propeller fold protein YncE
MRIGFTSVLIVSCLVAACAAPATSSRPSVKSSGTATSAGVSQAPGGGVTSSLAAPTLAQISGSVTVPLAQTAGHGGNIIAQGGGNIIAQGGGNIIAQGGGNVISPNGSNFHIAQVATNVHLAHTLVYLAGSDGKPLLLGKKTLNTLTDAFGNYRFRSVPAGLTYKVVVEAETTHRGQVATLASLVKAAPEGAVADISPATTMVTVKTLKDRKSLGDLDTVGFRKAVEATRVALVSGENVDFTSEAKVLARMEAVIAQTKELADTLAAVASKLNENAVTAEDLTHQMAVIMPESDSASVAQICAASPESHLLADASGAPLVFKDAGAVALGATGTLLVSDFVARQVWVVDTAGTSKRFADKGVTAPEAIGAAGTNIFVAEPYRHVIDRLDVAGISTAIFSPTSSPGLGDAASLVPSAVAVLPNGDLYLADGNTAKIFLVRFNQGKLTASSVAPDAPFLTPASLAVAPDGRLYVADTYNHCIWRVSPDGNAEIWVGSKLGEAGEPQGSTEAADVARLNRPVGIALSPDGATLYVADAGNQAIRAIATNDGHVSTLVALACDNTGAERLTSIGGLVVSADAKSLYVANGRHIVRFVLGTDTGAIPSSSPDGTASAGSTPMPTPSASRTPSALVSSSPLPGPSPTPTLGVRATATP